MPPASHPPGSATLADEPTSEQGNFKPRPAPRKAPMSSLPKKLSKGGGKGKRAPKKRGKKKVGEVESSDESLILSDIKDATIVEDPDNDSADDGGISAGGESDISEYKEKRTPVKRAAGKGVADKGASSKKPPVKKTTTANGGLARKVYTRKSAAAKSPKKREGKNTPGKKGRATVGNTEGEDPNLLDDSEDGYYPDEENDENYLETSKTPAKRAAKKVTGGSVGKGTARKTTRKTTADKKMPTKAAVKATTRSSLGRKSLTGPESECEQEGNSSNLLKEPRMTAATKRKALSQGDSRLKKVAKTAPAKNVGVIKTGLESLSLGSVDDDANEAGGSVGPSSSALRTGYIIKGGTSEQRAAIIAASSNNQGHTLPQSEPVIGKNRLKYGGKSVARLQALWEVGPPKYDSN